MIRVQLQPEPEDFQQKVAAPGRAFLAANNVGPNDILPENFPWEKASFWRAAHPQLHASYNGICAYLGLRFHSNAMGTDHFFPKKTHPWLAYEWSNHRLCYRAFNTSKGWKKPFCDPFEVENHWFDLKIWTGRVTLTAATNSLSPETLLRLQNTLEKLNEPDYLQMRLDYIDEWINQKIDLALIERWAPFVHRVITSGN